MSKAVPKSTPLIKKKKEKDEEDPGISNKQAMIYMAIVVVCFATLYPRMIHPMIKVALGLSEEKQATQESELPPPLRGHPMKTPMRPMPGGGRGANTGEAPETKSSKSSGGGMMTMILPVYAGGIVLYLIYTATKVYGGDSKTKKKKKKNGHEELYNLISKKLAGIDLEKVLSGQDNDGANEINQLAEYLRKERENDSDIELPSDEEVADPSPTSASSADKSAPVPSEEVENTADDDVNDYKALDTEIAKSCDAAAFESLLDKYENKADLDPQEMLKLQMRLMQMEGRVSKLLASMSAVQKQATAAAKTADELLTDQQEEKTDNKQTTKSKKKNKKSEQSHIKASGGSVHAVNSDSAIDHENLHVGFTDKVEVLGADDESCESDDEISESDESTEGSSLLEDVSIKNKDASKTSLRKRHK